MPKVNMYKYDDVVDLRIRRFIAKQLMTENEFLKKHHLNLWAFAKCRRDHRISRPLVRFLALEWVDFSWINFELDE